MRTSSSRPSVAQYFGTTYIIVLLAAKQDPEGLQLTPAEDKGADDIARINANDETVLHLAVRYDLTGVKDLIDRANKRAFSQRRLSKDGNKKQQLDDGNTPLHDAVDSEKLIVGGPICKLLQARSSNPGDGPISILQARELVPPTRGKARLS